jgi:hypothetical protein
MIDLITLIVFVIIILAVASALLVCIKDLIHIAYLYHVECKIYSETQHPEIFWTDLDFARIKKAHDAGVKRRFITSHYLN